MALKLAGSSSGFVALDAPASAGSNTLVLPASNGSANQYLKNSGTAGTLEFATLAAGKILQIVPGTPDTSARSTTSASWVTASTTINVQITPASTGSKILLLACVSAGTNDGDDGWAGTIYRDIGGTNTNLGNADAGMVTGKSVSGITGLYASTTMSWIDSPNTTSQCTYQMYFKLYDNDSDGHTCHINQPNQGSGQSPGYIHALEFT